MQCKIEHYNSACVPYLIGLELDIMKSSPSGKSLEKICVFKYVDFAGMTTCLCYT
jgi:hypothetical protein